MDAFLYSDGGEKLNGENNRASAFLFPLSVLLPSFCKTLLKS